MGIKEIESTVRELQELKRMKEDLEAEISSLEDKIKSEMGEREQMTAGVYRINWKTVVSNRIDTVALRKAFPEIAECFMKQTSTRRFSIN